MGMSNRELTILGAALYACEGAKERIDNRGRKQYAIDFTNNDPRLIKWFLKFLRNNFKVEEDRIKAQLFIYPDHNEQKLVNFWVKTTQIPKIRFNKVMHLIQKSGRFKPSIYGTMKVRYHHKEHFLKLKGIIDRVFEI
ncbi:hypothetical protein A2422_03910 [Candidatus Woesebacteria bacterium RIFOXYC1_FULL_31_51]|uniref:Uncharacterized protein n=1 Tax=Candidatus Woesebacteria bacterium GW2011_GWC2_31_9 TaxID=1618586 RepID=A0A0F9YLA4_9BACT|nr:MAG: hypothetical protein UR17_C0001G0318 [Candidatus Woesebacteria bacterium GW2011_GWF1_31_35]KKP23189.1 MAG: hypothetical protein UR11_C0001G0163 [Candidatus Woesebacteria bacterium GW2011_GWC1_30_29]KKP26877.1 MAG: hypothetical protein UR13_C0002G0112 [Candidatus Woesebacteria bacterium GW2011_GWD1_31_12]KKP27451.1 MAG: hypothetical protein UR16_C0003G0111 [Candidatus Woesebacteria bacterium GW2011_GWB1_31_29]KKP32033.1 MAG: hypothetical protein UR21_C0003G0066 [Candidatus Woesebacteria 